jgi:hypothetical protein
VRASLVFTLVAASIAFVAACHAPHSTDLYWQIPEGREVLRGTIPREVPWAIGAPPWTDHEWLFEALAAWCYDRGAFVVLVVLCALAAAAAPLLAYAAARDVGYDWASTSFAVLLVAASTSVSWSERPQNFVLLAFLGLLWIMWRGARPWWAPLVITCIWSNLHASGVLAPVLCVGFAAAYAVAGGPREPRARRSLAAALAALAGTLLTPHGPRLWAYAIDSMVDRNHSHRYIAEWLPLLNEDVLKAALVWLFVVGVAVAASLARRRDEIAPSLVGAAFLVLPLLHARFALFCAAAAMPLVAGSVRTVLSALPAARESRFSSALFAVPAIAAIVGVSVAAMSPALGTDREYADARGLLARHHLAGPVFAEYTAAAYLAAFSALPVRVMIDSHGDPFDARTWDDEFVLEHAAPGWDGVLRRRKLDIVVLPAGHLLGRAVAESPRWKRLDRTPHAVLFVVR